jgi:hypothetical protein
MRVEDKPKRDSRLFRLQGSAKFAKNHKTRPPGGAGKSRPPPERAKGS